MIIEEWIEEWLRNRLGEGNRFEQFNRRFCKDLISDFFKAVELTVLKEKDIKAGFVEVFDSTTTRIELFRICKEKGFIEAQLRHTKNQLLEAMK